MYMSHHTTLKLATGRQAEVRAPKLEVRVPTDPEVAALEGKRQSQPEETDGDTELATPVSK